MLTKYANHEAILEIKTASERLPLEEGEGAMLSKFAKTQSEPDVEGGYVYVRTRAISSRVNKNNDGWPSEELAKGYKTFVGRPVFVDHNNSDPRRTRGVIVDSKLHVEDDKVSGLDPYYSTAPDNHKPPTWVELLIEVDGKTYPKLAEAIKNGDIDATSMGANIEKSICSVCANEATVPTEYCNHIKSKGATFEVVADNGEKMQKKAYEDCYGVVFFEDSFVFDPADETALNIGVDDQLHMLSAVKKADGDDGGEDEGGEGSAFGEGSNESSENNEGAEDYQCDHCGNDLDKDDIEHAACPHCGRLFVEDHRKHKKHHKDSMWRESDLSLPQVYDWQAIIFGLGALGLGAARIRQWVEQLKAGASPDDVASAVPGAKDVIVDAAQQAKQPPQAPYDHAQDQQQFSHLISKVAESRPLEDTDSEDRQLNYEPQSDETTAPAKVDTLQDDIKCPNCGVDVLDADPDGILRCPTCQYEQPPEGLDAPDLGVAQNIDTDKTVGDDVDDKDVIRATDEDADDNEFIKPLTNDGPKQSATNSNVPTGVISEMNWTTKIATDSVAEANEALKTAAAVQAAYPGGQGIHNGTSAAFAQAGITAVVTLPGAPMPIPLPFTNPNMFVMLKMLQSQGVAAPGAPMTVESDNPELALQIIEQQAGATAGVKDKAPIKKNVILPQSGKAGDAPADGRVVSDQLAPVTSDRRVIKREETPDGHRTEQIVEETGDLLAGDEPKKEEPKAEEKSTDEGSVDTTQPRSQKERVESDGSSDDEEKDNAPPWQKKKEPAYASVEDKLLAALAVAEQAVEMKIIDPTKKMAFVGQLEDESMEEIEARRKTLALVKSAGLTNKKVIARTGSALPRMSYQSTSSSNGTGNLDDIPFESIFI